MLVAHREKHGEPGRDAWARNQAYIALSNLLTSGALLGIDACPMEGFNRAHYDEILGLKKTRVWQRGHRHARLSRRIRQVRRRAQGALHERAGFRSHLN
jgi:nitroreductase family protein